MAFLTKLQERPTDVKTATKRAALSREIKNNNAIAKKATSPLEIAKQTILGIPKAGIDVARDVAKGAVEFGVSAGEAPVRLLNPKAATAILPKTKIPYLPFLGEVESFQNRAARAVRDEGASVPAAVGKGVLDTALNEPLGLAVKPLAIGGGILLRQAAKNGIRLDMSVISKIMNKGKTAVTEEAAAIPRRDAEFAGQGLPERLDATAERKLPVQGDTTLRPIPVRGGEPAKPISFANDYRQGPDIQTGPKPRTTLPVAAQSPVKTPSGYRYEPIPETPRAPVAAVPRETAPMEPVATKATPASVSSQPGTRLYHGTAEDFDTFDRSRAGSGVGENLVDQGDQIYLTESPDAGKFFAQKASDRKSMREGALPGQNTNKGNVLEFEMKSDAKILEVDDMPRGYQPEAVDTILKQARAEGYDAVRFVDKGFDTIEGSPLVGKIYDELGRAPKTTIVLNDKIISRVKDVPRETTRALAETKVSGLAKGVETQAVEKKLTDTFEGLSQYETINIKDQAARAADIIAKDYDKAKRIALGLEEAPAGTKNFAVYTAVEQRAIKDGDVETLRDLATNSRLNEESSSAAQTLRLLAERDPESPVAAIADIAKTRAKAAEKRGVKAAEVKSEVTKAKETIKKAPKEDWNSFVDSITC